MSRKRRGSDYAEWKVRFGKITSGGLPKNPAERAPAGTRFGNGRPSTERGTILRCRDPRGKRLANALTHQDSHGLLPA
jgi:hypothetical protein